MMNSLKNCELYYYTIQQTSKKIDKELLKEVVKQQGILGGFVDGLGVVGLGVVGLGVVGPGVVGLGVVIGGRVVVGEAVKCE